MEGLRVVLKYLRFYEDRGIWIERAEGQYVWDLAGNRYLDMHTGHGVAFLGHKHPHVVEALIEQLGKAMAVSTSFNTRIREEMLSVLSKVVPSTYEYVYLLNSGSEAVDFALTASRRITGRKKLVYFTGSFHGRTVGSLSVTSNPKYRKGAEPLLSDVYQLRFNDVEGVERGITDEVAGVIIELIQGEGGVNVASRDFIKALRERTEATGALLIVDEVQTGFGRTGSVWLFEQYGIVPDILVAGKAIGGGFPVSVVFLPGDFVAKLGTGAHGSTYGGNPLACASVKASVEVLLEESVHLQAREKGKWLLEELRSTLKDLKVVRDVRGHGLMIGVELRVEPTSVLKCLQERGLLALKAGITVVRLLPPYLVTREDVNYAVATIGKCLGGYG
ncbi:MAG: aspartate aminotransferase family protein [Desulfurococcaceae archaeon]